MAKKQRVVILGGGFGGIKTALELCTDERFSVTLVSDQDHFRFYPALYHSATGGSRRLSVIPLAELFADKPVTVVKARATHLNRAAKTVRTKGGGNIAYDSLVVALGMTTNYFGIPGLQEFAYGVKSIEEAERFKSHLHQQLIAQQRPDLHYLIIGGGPTGVELAGALPGYLRRIIHKHGIKHRAIHISLIEAAPRILPRLPADVARATRRQLRRLGVKIEVNQKVEALNAQQLMVSGKPISSQTVVWTAGVTCSSFLADNKFQLTEHHKAAIDPYLQAEPDIYVIGDNADTPYSGVAQTALHDAQFVADHLKRLANGRKPKAYKAKRPVYVTPTGPTWASVVWGSVHVFGWMGWLLRRAADLRAYHFYQPWWPAARRWLAEDIVEDNCPICSNH